MDLEERGEPGPGAPSPGITLLDRAAKHHERAVGKSFINSNPQGALSQPEPWDIIKTSALYSAQSTSSFSYEYVSAYQGWGFSVAYFCSSPLLFQAEGKLLVWADQLPVEGEWMQLWLFDTNNTVVCKRLATEQQQTSQKAQGLSFFLNLKWNWHVLLWVFGRMSSPWHLSPLTSGACERPRCCGLMELWKNRGRGLRGQRRQRRTETVWVPGRVVGLQR